MIVITWYVLGCVVLAVRGHGQVAAWLLVPVTCWLIWRVAGWAYLHGLWRPGSGSAEPRWWGQRW